MNQHTEFQQYLVQQQQAYQLQHNQTAVVKQEQLVGTTEAVTTPRLGQLDTVALVQSGGIAAAIILCIAVLILALTEYNKVFVLMMLQKRDKN